MMYNSRMQPLSEHQILAWIGQFEPLELERMGWTPQSLMEALKAKEVVYRLDEGVRQSSEAAPITAAIIFHHVDQTTDEILFLATPPALRGKGLMRELLREFAAKKGAVQIWLECREDNLPAIRLYQGIGFVEVGRRSRYYKDGTTAILFNF